MDELVQRLRFRRDHRWAPGRMSDYREGDLSPRRRARIERHLGECRECDRLLAGLRLVVDALRRVPLPEGPDAGQIAASVRARLGEPRV
jgi:anti-sigma factor RsiW